MLAGIILQLFDTFTMGKSIK